MPYAIWSKLLVSCAGLLGACGVGLAAAGAHAGGGTFAETAAIFLLVHAAVIIGVTSWAYRTQRAWPLLAVATVMAIGVACFSGDLAVLALAGKHRLASLAPLGGGLMIVAWIGIAGGVWL